MGSCLASILLACMSFVGCGGASTAPDASTAAMADTLAQIAEEARTHPLDYFHLNHVRAESTRAAMEKSVAEASPQQRMTYANELLYAGETRLALQVLTALHRELGNPPVEPRTKPFYDLLALVYLRLGEQTNCRENPSAQACILPITGAGVHQDPTGSRNAVALYERIRDVYWSDWSALWLLNVGYMTLGAYPDDVPAQYRIEGLQPEAEAAVRPFRNVAMDLGVDHSAMAGGTNVEDFNNDGFLDVFATSYGLTDQAKLYLSDGEGGFVDHTVAAGLTGIVSGLNTTHADYNNDGFEDVLILRGAWLGNAGRHPNSLLRNNGDGTFTDVTVEAGLGARHPTQVGAWADVNRDGRIDLFVGNESSVEMNFLTGNRSSDAVPEHPSALYLNNGDGTFTDAAAAMGLEVNAYVKGADWGDVNDDGWPDLYVSVLGGANRLYMHPGDALADDAVFTERAAAAGVEAPRFSFPTWFWDYNQDGHDDLFVSGYDMRYLQRVAEAVAAEYVGRSLSPLVERPRLYRNNGDGTFTDATEEAGIDKIMFGMGANYGDLDNDGYPDFYVGTGAPDLRSVVPNRMFRNQGGRRFQEVTFAGGFGHIQKGHGVGFGDFDRDGDQDIYTVIGGAVEGDHFRNALFENPGHGGNWITLDLVGDTASNRSAIGARLTLTITAADGTMRTLHRTVGTGGSFGASSLQQEIGLGTATQVDTLTITWPNAAQSTQTFRDLEANQHVRILEGQPAPEPLARPPVPLRTSSDAIAARR